MNSRERLACTLDHRQPDRPPVDFGATFVTGIHVSVVDRLRRRLLGDSDFLVKVIEPYQMLGEIDDELREALGIDVVGVPPRKSMFGTENRDWKEFVTFDGVRCLIPGQMNLTRAPDGGWYMHPEGDTSAPPSAHMPAGGYFFDAVIRQEPIQEAHLNPEDNAEEFTLLGAEDLAYYQEQKAWLEKRPQLGAVLVVPGTGFGDIALVPAPWMKRPRGIRDISEWYISLKTRRDYIHAVFQRQCEVGLKNLQTLIDLFGRTVQVAMITGTDFGTQRGPFLSPEDYRELFQPYHRRVNELVHARSSWKSFIHSCGSVYRLIPDFIEAGFDILNPVQCTAAEMDARRLKAEFGDRLVFWGGGVDTQQTMAFGTPEEVYRQVRERLEVFGQGGEFVFNSIHNIQGNTPIENVEAMFRALREAAEGR